MTLSLVPVGRQEYLEREINTAVNEPFLVEVTNQNRAIYGNVQEPSISANGYLRSQNRLTWDSVLFYVAMIDERKGKISKL